MREPDFCYDPDQVRTDLRRLAIKQHVRLTDDGGHVNNGKSCAVCKGEWADDAPEFHALTCTAAIGLPAGDLSAAPNSVSAGCVIALLRALMKIAHYSPASTVQPVAIARETLIGAIGTWQQGALDSFDAAQSSRPCGDATTCVCEIVGRTTCIHHPDREDSKC